MAPGPSSSKIQLFTPVTGIKEVVPLVKATADSVQTNTFMLYARYRAVLVAEISQTADPQTPIQILLR